MIRVVRHENVTSFLDSARDWLLSAEAENNLLLGIAGQLASRNHPYKEPVYLAVVETEGEVSGCAFRTPPFGFGVTRMPSAAIPALIQDVGAEFSTLPSVIGPEDSASAFATEWSRRVGCSWHVGMRQRIYVLTVVQTPANLPAGKLRLATSRDFNLLDEWAQEFIRESHLPSPANENLAGMLMEERCLYVWDDGNVRTMAAARGPTPNGIRIGFVFTPAEFRGRGYASACVAALSEHQLSQGKAFCFLYTDLANPTSNSIYQRIGYNPVSDAVMCMFDDEPR